MDNKIRVHRGPQTLITGLGSIAQVAEQVRKLRGTRVLILTDPGVAGCGDVTYVEEPLREAALEVGVYDHAVPEPPMASLHEVVDFVEDGGFDCVIGFGGGSAIDVAKMAAVLAHTGHHVEEYVGVDMVPKKGLPLIAIPTTAGTGSEVTAIAIFANEAKNIKQGVVSPHLIPDIAIVDPVLTLTCPPNVTAASGIDALIHNMEAFISVNATLHTDPLAKEGMELIGAALRTAVLDGSNLEARHDMAIGSMLGGIAFGNAGVGAVHALSYPLGGRFHVPHGVANAVMLPWVMEYNMLACLPRFRDIACALGETVEGLSAREVAVKAVGAMRQLADDVGLPQHLSDLDISADAIEELTEGALTQTRLLANNPRKLTHDDIYQIYLNAAVRPVQTERRTEQLVLQ